MTQEQIEKERVASPASASRAAPATTADLAPATGSYTVLLLLAWTAVALPLAWGGWIALSKALAFFK